MDTRIKINTDELNMDVLEGIKKLFPHKMVEITIQEEAVEEYLNDDKYYIEGDEDATEFILNRPGLAAELDRRIMEFEGNKKVNQTVEEQL